MMDGWMKMIIVHGCRAEARHKEIALRCSTAQAIIYTIDRNKWNESDWQQQTDTTIEWLATTMISVA